MNNRNVQTSSNEESSSTPSNNNGAKKTLFALKKRMFSSPNQRASDIISRNCRRISDRTVANTNIVDSTIQQDPETNCSSANDEILSSFNHFSAEISRISEHRAIKEDVDVSQLSNNEIDECGTMYGDLLETISDVFLNLPKHLIKTQPGFNDSIHTKSKAVVDKLKKITKHRTIKLNAQHNGPRTIYSEPSVERSDLLENPLPSSSGSVIKLCSSSESISVSQNESSIEKKSKSSFVPKTRKSTSLDNADDEPSTSSTLDRFRAASGKLQPVQNEKPKNMPPPASSVPFQPPFGDTPFCPSSENSVPTLNDEFELENVDWDDDIQDFNDAVDIPVDEADWPKDRPEDIEMQDERVDESDNNQRNEGDRFDNENYPHSVILRETLRKTFGLSEFRPRQLRIINATLLRHDCFVILPTGAGKSLCYQLPAVLTPGVTIVVSPLISLIVDQVNKLLKLGIAAAHLSGDLTEVQMNAVYLKLAMAEPAIKLLYVTPEKLMNHTLRMTLKSLYIRRKIGRFVVDEAHCVSQWGNVFRPDYKRLNELRENYCDVPLMALTATATPRVLVDIERHLGFGSKSPEERSEFVQSKGHCFNCLSPNHNVRGCHQATCCRRCDRRHHTLLHFERGLRPEASASSKSTEKSLSPESTTEKNIIAHFVQEENQSEVLLATALVRAKSADGYSQILRVLIDQGSEASFISVEVHSEIMLNGLLRHPSKIGPIAQNTKLGWILSGRVTSQELTNTRMINLHLQVKEDLLLKQFWEIEREPDMIGKPLTKEEIKCEEIYEETTVRNEEGRYVVRLPFKKIDPGVRYGK
ncbi:unnamed protein product, partial [Brenthis ino]